MSLSHSTKSFVLVAALALSLVGMGCGNSMLKANQIRSTASQSSWSGSQWDDVQYDGNFACPTQANILPIDSGYGEQGQYRGCVSRSSASEVLVRGTSRGSEKVCVFPAEKVDDDHVYYKPELGTGLPWAICGSPSSGGFVAKFTGLTNFNVLFIVESADKNAMQSCLAMNAPYACPIYSRGKIR